ncbi:Uncharacterised protein [Acinetobacter phage MD-2021a]|nr:Uncharacterised protein [Acinetobacter phage MD-2021a]CAH1088684.1 Uncharacterised protein [Acinetobacter phage MD-2021a]
MIGYIKGFKKTPMVERTYGIWRAIQQRAYHKTLSENHHSSLVYRDVSVCDRWVGKDGFKNFVEDVGLCPSEKHTINRINGHLIYENGFVEWSLPSVQKYDTKLQSNNTSGVRGLYLNKRGYWISSIKKDGKLYRKYSKQDYKLGVKNRVHFEYEVFGFSKTIGDYLDFGLNDSMIKNGMTDDYMISLIKE